MIHKLFKSCSFNVIMNILSDTKGIIDTNKLEKCKHERIKDFHFNCPIFKVHQIATMPTSPA